MPRQARSSSSATGSAAWRSARLADLHGVGIKRIKLAPPDVVLQLLGYPAGGVPPIRP